MQLSQRYDEWLMDKLHIISLHVAIIKRFELIRIIIIIERVNW